MSNRALPLPCLLTFLIEELGNSLHGHTAYRQGERDRLGYSSLHEQSAAMVNMINAPQQTIGLILYLIV